MRTDQCRLLVVCSDDGAVEACRDVGQYMEWQREKMPATKWMPDSPLIGMWIQATTPDLPCERLGIKWESDQRVFNFRESLGVNGKWSLWCLDVDRVAESAGSMSLRESMLVSLTRDLCDAGPRFAPIFDAGEAAESTWEETSRIARQFSTLVMPALISNTDTGTFYPLPATRRRDD